MSSGISTKEYWMAAIDPLHVGSGGIHLGKVDNPITLDPATHLPKVPGTGISGAVKYFTDLGLIALEREDEEFSIGRREKQSKEKTVWCASTRGACNDNCMMCYTFGYSTKDGRNSKGVISFCDAHLVLFPVYSAMCGRVWITSDSIFRQYFEPVSNPGATPLSDFQVKTLDNQIPAVNGQIEIGGYMFSKQNGALQSFPFDGLFKEMGLPGMGKRVLVVSDEKFPALVQRNLEQRTSVAIDPETGAAKEGALFTFEAVPAHSAFAFEITKNEYKIARSPFNNGKNARAIARIKKDLDLNGSEFGPFELIQFGFRGIQEFGMGGMNTRGFGRLKIFERHK